MIALLIFLFTTRVYRPFIQSTDRNIPIHGSLLIELKDLSWVGSNPKRQDRPFHGGLNRSVTL